MVWCCTTTTIAKQRPNSSSTRSSSRSCSSASGTEPKIANGLLWRKRRLMPKGHARVKAGRRGRRRPPPPLLPRPPCGEEGGRRVWLTEGWCRPSLTVAKLWRWCPTFHSRGRGSHRQSAGSSRRRRSWWRRTRSLYPPSYSCSKKRPEKKSLWRGGRVRRKNHSSSLFFVAFMAKTTFRLLQPIHTASWKGQGRACPE